MKIHLRSNRPFHFFAALRLRGKLLFFLLPAICVTALWAAPPAWWSQQQVLDSLHPASVDDNYAPANLGQLKHVAKQAKAHLDASLPGGAGTAIDTLVTGFGGNLTTEQRDANYAPINLGQLKAVAKPFYDRLLSAGYDTKANLIAHGYPATWGFDYPWNPTTPAEDNYAPANLGQLKIAFSFDASTLVPPVDTDGDGIPDNLESAYGTDPLKFSSGNNGTSDGWWISHGLDPFSDTITDTDGDGRSDAQEFLDGTDPLTWDADPNAGASAPLAPSGLALTTLDNGHNELIWTNNSTANGVIVERTGDGANWQTVGVVPGTQTTFTDATAQPATVYFYRVAAFN